MASESDPSPSRRKYSIQQALATKLTRAIREEQDRAVGSGVERGVRWRAWAGAEGSNAARTDHGLSGAGSAIATAPPQADDTASSELEGNAFNAAMVAGAKAAAVCPSALKYRSDSHPLHLQVVKRRLKVFQSHQVAGYEELSTALIGSTDMRNHAPLRPGDFTLVLDEGRVLVGRGAWLST